MSGNFCRQCVAVIRRRIAIVGMGIVGCWSMGAHAQRGDREIFSIGVGLDNALAGSGLRPGVQQPYLSIGTATKVLVDGPDLRGRFGTDVSPYGFWFGFGASVEVDLLETPIYLEASFMPGLWFDFDHEFRSGLYRDGLGHIVEFRSQAGIGWHIDENSSLLLSLSHKSNGNIPGALSNPGIESLQLRYAQSF